MRLRKRLARAREAGRLEVVQGQQNIARPANFDDDERAAYNAGRNQGMSELNWLALKISDKGQFVPSWAHDRALQRIAALEAAVFPTEGEAS